MSISRKNWSALSSLARQWTVEDEEEVEREKRRKVRGPNSTADSDDDDSPRDPPSGGPTNDSGAREPIPANDGARGRASADDGASILSSSTEQPPDFMEMLRVRNEKRRMRQMETLRRQKEEEEGGGGGGGSSEARVEILGDVNGEEVEEMERTEPPRHDPPRQTHAPAPTPTPSTTTTIAHDKQHESGSSSETVGSGPQPPPKAPRKFVSSVSISFDQSPCPSERSGPTSPMSPRSPTNPLSPREQRPSPSQSPTHNGHTPTSVNVSPASGLVSVQPTSRQPFARQSSRTASFRMLKKKEEESMPLQRSASVRTPSKTLEGHTDRTQEESPFQRNSRQRVSSRTIQEKMERLAQAAQKSEMIRSPEVPRRTLFLLDEVTRKRGLFEKEQAAGQGSPGVLKQEHRSFASGISDRINRWVHKTGKSVTSHNTADLRNVDIGSKRSVFESRGEEGSLKPGPNSKVYK